MTDLDHVKREFGKLTFMAIDDPYQYVCDYYQDYIINLKKDKRNEPYAFQDWGLNGSRRNYEGK